jgi:hypothetical protein
MLQYSLAVLPAILLLLVNKPSLALAAFIVLGQGHFLLTYLYQYRGGKMTRFYLSAYLLCLPLAYVVAVYLPITYLLTLTAIVFAVHYFYDESRIMLGNNYHLSLLLIVPPILLFISYLLYEQLHIDSFIITLIISGAILLRVWYRFGSTALAQPYVLVTNALAVLLYILYIRGAEVPSELILGAIIIHHYTTWYIFQYKKLRKNTDRVSQYLTDVLVVNVALIVGYILYRSNPNFNALEYLYGVNFFYTWTLLHIIFASHDLIHAIRIRITKQ